jgi:hypothetical protein
MIKAREQNIIFIICALVILYTLYRSERHSQLLEKDYGFTVGKTLKYSFADGQKDCIEYKYFVDSVKFKSCVVDDSAICPKLGKFYKVKYSKQNPNICELYLTNEIKDSVKIYNSGYLRKWHKKKFDNLHAD